MNETRRVASIFFIMYFHPLPHTLRSHYTSSRQSLAQTHTHYAHTLACTYTPAYVCAVKNTRNARRCLWCVRSRSRLIKPKSNTSIHYVIRRSRTWKEWKMIAPRRRFVRSNIVAYIVYTATAARRSRSSSRCRGCL